MRMHRIICKFAVIIIAFGDMSLPIAPLSYGKVNSHHVYHFMSLFVSVYVPLL